MALTFQHEGLAALLADAKASWPKGVRTLYGDHDEPGFWLVGDTGVYLMHNGQAWEADKALYADESNPRTMEFDDWWNGKVEHFGGDDDVQFMPAQFIAYAVKGGYSIRVNMRGDFFTVDTFRAERVEQ